MRPPFRLLLGLPATAGQEAWLDLPGRGRWPSRRTHDADDRGPNKRKAHNGSRSKSLSDGAMNIDDNREDHGVRSPIVSSRKAGGQEENTFQTQPSLGTILAGGGGHHGFR
jgi:hypothetical protein